MDFLQMLYTVTIADSASMAKAAERLSLSQSTLSLSYRKLEEELGVSLFHREGRRLVLTAEGRIFCEEAKDILRRTEALKDRMEALSAEKERTIDLCSEAVDFSNEAVKIFTAAFPDISVRQIQGSESRLAALLRDGEAQIAITLSDQTGGQTTSSLLLDEPMYIILPPSDTPDSSSELSMKDLAGLPLVTQTEGLGISRLIRSFYDRAGIRPGRIREVQDLENIPIQAINNYGVGFLPECVARSSIPEAMFRSVNASLRPLSDEYCRRQVYLTTVDPVRHTAPVLGFLDFLRCFGRFVSENKQYPTLDDVSVAGRYRLRV